MAIDVMTLRAVREELDVFLADYDAAIKTRPSRSHFRGWVGGQLSSLERKSVEPIALAMGVRPRTLQEFLSVNRWDHDRARAITQQKAAAHVGDRVTLGVIDETGFPKRGDKIPAVQRQYCGQTGKTDNCVVAVQLALATSEFHSLIDAEPFLPERSWSDDRERCRAAGIPDDVVHRPKWKIGLELYERAVGNGVRFDWIVADEAYGMVGDFRDALNERGQRYVVEIPPHITGWSRKPRFSVPEQASTTGRPRTRAYLEPGERTARRIDSLWQRGGPSWQDYRVKMTTKGEQIWTVRATRFWPACKHRNHRDGCWLLIAVNPLNQQHKYFLSNASDATPAEIIEAAFGRWHIEKCFEEAKQQIGMGHFEVRTWQSLCRHLILSTVSLLFLSLQTQRLRGEKSGPVVEPQPSSPRDRSPA